MKRHRLIAVLGVTLVIAGWIRPAFGILGIGDIVFDPSNYAEAIQQLLQLQQQYAQLVQSYQMIRSQYEQMIQAANIILGLPETTGLPLLGIQP